jgi:uncharacterized protein
MAWMRIVLHGNLPDLAGSKAFHERRLPGPTSVRDALEALGLPHGEIGAIQLDGRPASLGALVTGGELLEAWPRAAHRLTDPRFICDQHLGKLARLLRFCGFDTLWERSASEPALARLAVAENRTMLSRHRALLKRSVITSSLLVRSDHADQQLVEVLRRFLLADGVRRPGRCTACNGHLGSLKKHEVTVAIPPRTAAWLDDYWLCHACGQLFWDGTHVERLRARVAAAVKAT